MSGSAGFMPVPRWQSIETAPRDGTAILASGLDHGKGTSRHYSVVKWIDSGCESGWYSDEDANPLIYLTHWMPLPAPPPQGYKLNTETDMSTIFDGSPVYRGTYGDQARVAIGTNGRVLIRAADTMAEEAVTIAMTPQQARALAQEIIMVAEKAETSHE